MLDVVGHFPWGGMVGGAGTIWASRLRDGHQLILGHLRQVA
jgi:hypothetical protein